MRLDLHEEQVHLQAGRQAGSSSVAPCFYSPVMTSQLVQERRDISHQETRSSVKQ